MRPMLALLALAMLTGCATPQPPVSPSLSEDRAAMLRDRFLDQDDVPMVAAHRGCWKNAPENSVQAIRDCIALGIDIVEIDVRRSRDGHLVVIHDVRVDRTTNGTGKVSDLTLGDLRALRLRTGKGGHDATLTDERIPTLAEAIAAAKGAILVNIDAKPELVPIPSPESGSSASGCSLPELVPIPYTIPLCSMNVAISPGSTLCGRT